MELHFTATECHLPYGITQCYLPPDTSEHSTHPALTPAIQAGTRFTDPKRATEPRLLRDHLRPVRLKPRPRNRFQHSYWVLDDICQYWAILALSDIFIGSDAQYQY